MTTSYKDYLTQIEDLQKKASAARKAETETAIREVRRLISEYGLTAQEIGLDKAPRKRREAAVSAVGKSPAKRRGGTSRKSPPAARKVPPKYTGPNGELWTGRGRRPVWVTTALEHGASLTDLQIPMDKDAKELAPA